MAVFCIGVMCAAILWWSANLRTSQIYWQCMWACIDQTRQCTRTGDLSGKRGNKWKTGPHVIIMTHKPYSLFIFPSALKRSDRKERWLHNHIKLAFTCKMLRKAITMTYILRCVCEWVGERTVCVYTCSPSEPSIGRFKALCAEGKLLS